MFKAIKKRIIKDSELKSVLPDLKKQVEKAEKKSFLEFIEKLRETPENFRITALQAKSMRK